MRLVDADKIYPDCMTKDGKLAISQSQLADAPTVEDITVFCENIDEKTIEDLKSELGRVKNELRPQGKWIRRRIIAKDRSFDMVVCSNCQTEFSWDAETGVAMDNYKTCPNCDAKMQR